MIEIGRIHVEDSGNKLESALGDEVKSRILTVLIRDGGQLNPSRISQRAGIDLATFEDHIHDLEDDGLVVYTLIVGNGPVYEVNEDAVAKALEDVTDGKARLAT
jgi:DNA-binding transcriptional ArsR family regulator